MQRLSLYYKNFLALTAPLVKSLAFLGRHNHLDCREIMKDKQARHMLHAKRMGGKSSTLYGSRGLMSIYRKIRCGFLEVHFYKALHEYYILSESFHVQRSTLVEFCARTTY